MARDIDLDRLGLEPMPEHTKNWCRLGKLQWSLMGRTQVVAWVKQGILVEIGDDPMEKECEKPRWPLCPQAPF